MNMIQAQEEAAYIHDSSRFDGFDRGTVWADEPAVVAVTIGRMTSEAGKRVEIDQVEDTFYVFIDGALTFETADRARAIRVARWWMDGCPA